MNIIEVLKELLGSDHVMTGSDTEGYDHDWTGKYSATPLAVVRPKNTEEVSATVKICNETKTPIVPVSGNTGLAGGTYAPDAVMISLERLNTIREIRPEARIAIVEAGVVLANLRAAAEDHDLAFPLTFGAQGSAMIGGCLSTNAGGSNVVRYGNTRDLCLGIEAVLPDGRIMDLMSALHKDNSGYDLKNLMIGAEGTLGLITAAVLKLVPKPRAYATAMVAARGLEDGLTLLNLLQKQTGGGVEAFEYMPKNYIEKHLELFDKARPPFEKLHDVNLLIEVGATSPNDTTPSDDGTIPIVENLQTTLAEMLEDGLILDAVVAQSETQRREMWERREAAAEIALGKKPLINNDVAVPLDRVATFIERMDAKLMQLDPGAGSMTVSHLGDGNIHYTIHPTTNDPAVHDQLMEAVEDLTLQLGGSFSAEHGIGISKKPSMVRRKDKVAVDVMRAIKTALDSNGIMNPGKVIPDAP